MVDFKPDETQESKQSDPTVTRRHPREIYSSLPNGVKTLAKLVAAAVIIIILVLIGRAIHHHTKQDTTASKPGTSSATNKKQANSTNQKENSPSNSSKNSPSKSTGGSGASPESSQLPNSGPGDVAAVFAGASALGMAAHYTLNRRRV